VVLLTAWHLPHMRQMPASFVRVRRLDRRSKPAPGCDWMHRWISRRSLLLTSPWESEAAAQAWLASPRFRAVDGWLRRRGATPRLERLSAVEAPATEPPGA
jgi:heme-degrading monooxygenase HmoA